MDLNNYDTSKTSKTGSDLHLKDPIDDVYLYDEEGNSPVVITVLGIDSKVFSEKKRESTIAKTAKMRRGKSFDLIPTDEETCDILASCTLGWSGIKKGGEYVEFSLDAAYQLYIDYPWIRDQVNEFVGDRSNFFTRS